MCIIYCADNGFPPESIFDEWDKAATNNPDGVGIAVRHPTEGIRVVRALDSARWPEVVDRAVDRMGERSPWMLHFRLATHGATILSNVHPFRAGKGRYLAHNGILSDDAQLWLGRRDPESDSAALAKVLAIAKKPNKVIRTVIGGSRIALLTRSGIQRYGHGWRWHDDIGMWTSTTRPGQGYRYCGYGRGGAHGRWDDDDSLEAGLYRQLDKEAENEEREEMWDRWLRGEDENIVPIDR